MGPELAEASLLQFLQPLDTASLSLRSLPVSMSHEGSQKLCIRAINLPVTSLVVETGSWQRCADDIPSTVAGAKTADLSLEEADSMATMCAQRALLRVFKKLADST